MLRLSATYQNRAILSLRTGSPVGKALAPIINPNNLKVEAWHATANGEKGAMILPSIEIRDIISKGLVVNDHDSITDPDDLVRMRHVIDLKFELIGKTVRTEDGTKLGKVTDYAVDDSNYVVKKLYVTPPLMKSFSGEQLIIDRNDIVEITSRKIVVRDLKQRISSGKRATAPAT